MWYCHAQFRPADSRVPVVEREGIGEYGEDFAEPVFRDRDRGQGVVDEDCAVFRGRAVRADPEAALAILSKAGRVAPAPEDRISTVLRTRLRARIRKAAGASSPAVRAKSVK